MDLISHLLPTNVIVLKLAIPNSNIPIYGINNITCGSIEDGSSSMH